MADALSVIADVDMRGFRHALEPLWRKETWKLERLLLEHRKLCQQVQAREATIRELIEQQHAEAAAIGAAFLQRLDPGYHRRALAYLEQLHAQLASEREQLHRDVQAQAMSQKACVAQHTKVEGLEQHREAAMATYAGEERLRQAAEADREWMARPQMSRPIEAPAPRSNFHGERGYGA